MAQLIAPPATAASISTPIVVQTRRHVTVMASPALTAAETATIQISPDNGQTWIVSPIGVLDVGNTTRLIATPGLYRVSKGATVGSVAIYVATEENP